MKNKKTLIFIFTFALLTGCVSVENNYAPIRRDLFEDSKYIFVTWENYDGDILRKQRYLKGEDDFTYVGKTPYKEADAQYTYVFDGWSNPQRDRDGNITYVAQYENVLNKYFIYWLNYDGTILEKDRDVYYGTTPSYDSATPTKPATAQYTYTFSGWSPSVQMVTRDQTYYATFTSIVNSYSLTYDPAGGTCSIQTETYLYGSAIHLPTPTRKGYTFDGWYDGNTKITDGKTWTYGENKTFTARWSIITYTITYQLDDGTNSSSNPSTYNVESPTITLVDATKRGFSFIGWTSENSPITSIPTGSTGDIILTANWSMNNYQVSIIVNNDSLGYVLGSGSYYFSNTVTLTAIPNGDNVFKGWYSDSGMTTLLSSSNPYSFTNIDEEKTIYAKFFTKSEQQEEEQAIKYATRPIASENGRVITYGLYPQTNVNKSSLVSALNLLTEPEPNGWYLYNDEYYAKVEAAPYAYGIKFDNGTTIVGGETYWFKCEPIVWNVLSSNNYERCILSNVLLDAQRFTNLANYTNISGAPIWSNDYEYSDIRTWLNNDFYNSAFALSDSHIQTTVVDNSTSSTDYSSSYWYDFNFNNTSDKVFLLSYVDYTNSNYEFSTSADPTNTRYCKTTDWARARGGMVDRDSTSILYNNGYYWTRSPCYVKNSNGINYTWVIESNGILKSAVSNTGVRCTRPALVVDVSDSIVISAN